MNYWTCCCLRIARVFCATHRARAARALACAGEVSAGRRDPRGRCISCARHPCSSPRWCVQRRSRRLARARRAEQREATLRRRRALSVRLRLPPERANAAHGHVDANSGGASARSGRRDAGWNHPGREWRRAAVARVLRGAHAVARPCGLAGRRGRRAYNDAREFAPHQWHVSFDSHALSHVGCADRAAHDSAPADARLRQRSCGLLSSLRRDGAGCRVRGRLHARGVHPRRRRDPHPRRAHDNARRDWGRERRGRIDCRLAPREGAAAGARGSDMGARWGAVWDSRSLAR